MIGSMEGSRLRSAYARVMAVGLWAVSMSIAVAILVSTPRSIALYGFPAFLATVGWAIYWQPYVTVDPTGVTLHNVIRTITLPWPAVESFDLRFGLGVNTRWHKKYTAWALPAARRAPAASVQAVLDYHLGLKKAGHLDNPRYTEKPPTGKLNTPECVILAVSALWAAVGVITLL